MDAPGTQAAQAAQAARAALAAQAARVALEGILVHYKDTIIVRIDALEKGWRGVAKDVQGLSECYAVVGEAMRVSSSGALAPDRMLALSHTAHHIVWVSWIHWTCILEQRVKVLARITEKHLT